MSRSVANRGAFEDGEVVVLCAANPWDGVKLADHHVAERLCRLVPVLYVDPPVSHLSHRHAPALVHTLKEPRLRMIGPTFARLTPVVLPKPERIGMQAVTNRLLRRYLRQAVTTLGGRVRAVVATRPLLRPFGSCGEQLDIFWVQDDLVAGADLLGLPASRLRKGERRLAGGADLIVAATPSLAETWQARGYSTILIANGCDPASFAETDSAGLPDDVDLPAPIAGFVGHLNDRIDFDLLDAIAERGQSLLLVGPQAHGLLSERLERLVAHPNVRWVGPKEFSDLPRYLRVIDVGLVPYAGTPFNRASFPMKILEYLSAGRGVVCTDLPVTKWLGSDLIDVASGPRSFADAVDRALSRPRTAELVVMRRAFAAGHSWDRRAHELADAIGIVGTGPRTES